jgi:WD40 repeat protein
MFPAVAIFGVLGVLSAADDGPTYERNIRPIFVRRCTICHNKRDSSDVEISGGLALDSYDAARQGTPNHPVFLPGKSGDSALWQRLVETDLEKRMPLYEDALPDRERLLIQKWIDTGAVRGEPVTVAKVNEPNTKRNARVQRSLDVRLNVDAKLPSGAAGLKQGGPIELTLKAGPLPGVTALSFRPDGQSLAVGTLGFVVLWDLREGRPSATLGDVPGPVHALLFSKDGRRLAVGSGLPARSGSVRIYTVPDGSLAQSFEGHKDVVYSLALRPDGNQLASAGFDSTVRLWNLADGSAAGVFRGHSDFVYQIAYSPDGRTILSSSKDRSVKRFDAKTVKGLVTYSDHDDDVLSLAIRPDGRQFVSAGNEPQLRWWNLEGDKPTKRVGGHSGPVYQLAFSADGKRLISAGGDGSVRLWDGANGNSLRSFPGARDWQYAVALSPDGRVAAAGGWDGFVRIWDAEQGALRATLLQPSAIAGERPDWLIVTPSGYVAGSSAMISRLRFRVGAAEAAAPVLLAELGRVDRVASELRGEAGVRPFSGSTEPPK